MCMYNVLVPIPIIIHFTLYIRRCKIDNIVCDLLIIINHVQECVINYCFRLGSYDSYLCRSLPGYINLVVRVVYYMYTILQKLIYNKNN